MTKFLIVTEANNLSEIDPEIQITSPQNFIQNYQHNSSKKFKPRIINLCKSYDYLSKGYYVSLLAEARGFKCVPKVSDIIKLNWRRNYQSALHDLNSILNKHYSEVEEEPLIRTYTSFFGRHENEKIEPLARRIFDLFRFPIFSFEIENNKNGQWQVNKIEAESISDLSNKRLSFFLESLDEFTGLAWKDQDKNKKQEKYWIGMLHDPNEKMPPSNKKALKKFITIGKKMGLWVELITKSDFSSLLEFDAIFIRETTAINNHTFRFASKAELEDIPCMDDTSSIIKCCNKVFLNELMKECKILTPETVVIDKTNLSFIADEIEYPSVIKIPDGSFSIGTEKVSNPEDLKKKALEMLKKSEVIICQEFLESEFDWRIGILNNEPLFAIKYFMAKDHWQIYNHGSKTNDGKTGDSKCYDLKDVPDNVLKFAQKATKPIGKGLYGVDLKQLKDGRIVLIEVNDNPNIDNGVEDAFLGDELYEKILEHLVRLIEE
jgi:glutathione synthase/RimK-type ligase-like ATP-grasp enzyme